MPEPAFRSLELGTFTKTMPNNSTTSNTSTAIPMVASADILANIPNIVAISMRVVLDTISSNSARFGPSAPSQSSGAYCVSSENIQGNREHVLVIPIVQKNIKSLNSTELYYRYGGYIIDKVADINSYNGNTNVWVVGMYCSVTVGIDFVCSN